MRKNTYLHRQTKRMRTKHRARPKPAMFRHCRITAWPYKASFTYVIDIQDPIYGRYHQHAESEKTYPSALKAIAAAKKYIDNYEPDDQPSRESDERMSFREQMAEYQKLK